MSTWLLRLHSRDERLLHALILRRRRMTDHAMRGITHLGDAVVTIGVTIMLLLGAVPSVRAGGRYAAVALVASHLGVQLLKRTIHRSRPTLPIGHESLIRAPDRFSFPSGHAASSLSVALGAATLLPPPGSAIVVLLALLVGISRSYLGVHYPGDVVAGWMLAMAGAALAGIIL